MATTIRQLTTDRATGGRLGPRRRVALGAAVLGCAAALSLGGLRGQVAPPAERQRHAPVAAAQGGTLSGGSYADTVWELEQARLAANGGGVQASAPLSGGSYADTVWELEQARLAATAGAARYQAPLSGGSYADTIWELEELTRAEQARQP